MNFHVGDDDRRPFHFAKNEIDSNRELGIQLL